MLLPTKIMNQSVACGDLDLEVVSTRRALLLASLLAGLPFALSGKSALAGTLDAPQTAITPADAIQFVPWSGAPPLSGEMATLHGGL